LLELLPYYSWIIDRFHLSTKLFQRMVRRRDYDFTWLEERLDALGFCLVFCTRTPDSFARAREKRISVSGNPSQYDDLQLFVDEQELFRQLVRESILPTLEVDISDDDLPRVVDQIADWMEETGLLWAR
jgi:hypothetical protein